MHVRTTKTTLTLTLTLLVLMAAATPSASGRVLAKPPTATPVPPAEGVIYYKGPGTDSLWFINANGTGATQIDSGVQWTPSRLQHGGKRWLAQYSANLAQGTYPNGQYRGEIVLYSIDTNGNAVDTITYVVPADLERVGQAVVKWRDDPISGAADGLVSWPARRWDLNAAPPVIVEGGIYTAKVLFHPTTGDVTGIDDSSVDLAVPFALSPIGSGGQEACYNVGGGWFANIWQLDWQPGASRVVYTRCTDNVLFTADTAGTHTSMNATGTYPDWSVGGSQSRIVFVNNGNIVTIDPNAASPAGTIKTIVAAKSKGTSTYSNARPFWSPTGSHVVFGRYYGLTTTDLLYVSAGGGSATLLDDFGQYPTGWVAAPAP